MPTVDFTLTDIKELVSGLLVQEREHTRQLLAESAENTKIEIKTWVADQFVRLWEHNIEPAFEALRDELQTEVRAGFNEINRRLDRSEREVKTHQIIIDQHSRDIMELRARQA